MGKDWIRKVTAGSALLLITVVALAILAFAPGDLSSRTPLGPKPHSI